MRSPSVTSEPFVVSRANDIETERWLGDEFCSPAGDSGQSISITNDGSVRTRAEIGAQLHKRIGMTDSATDDWLMTGRKKEQRRPFDVIWSRACWPEEVSRGAAEGHGSQASDALQWRPRRSQRPL